MRQLPRFVSRQAFQNTVRFRATPGLTGAEAAERILHSKGIYDVRIQHIAGSLTDNYNPTNKTLNLSDATYNSRSVAAIGVAAHECGIMQYSMMRDIHF